MDMEMQRDDCSPGDDGDSTSSEDSNRGRSVRRMEEIMDNKKNRSPLFYKLRDNIKKPRRSVVQRVINKHTKPTPFITSTPFNKSRSKGDFFLNTTPLDIIGDKVENNLDTSNDNVVRLQLNTETSGIVNRSSTTQNLHWKNNGINKSVIHSPINKGNVSGIRMPVPSMCGEPVEIAIEENGDQSVHNETRYTEKSVQLDGKNCINAIENCTNVSKPSLTSLNKSSTIKTYKNTSKNHSNAIKNIRDPLRTLDHLGEEGTNTSNIHKDSINNVHDPSGNSNHLNEASTSSENQSYVETARYPSRKTQTPKTFCERLYRLEKEVKVMKSKTLSDETHDKASQRNTTENEKLRNPRTRKTCAVAVTRHPEVKYISHRKTHVNGKFQKNKTWTCERSASPGLSPCQSRENVENFEISKKKENLHRVVDKLCLKRHNEISCHNEQVVKECKEVQTSVNSSSNNILQTSYNSVLFKTIPNSSRRSNNYFESVNTPNISPSTLNKSPWRFTLGPSTSEGVSSIKLNFLRTESELEYARNVTRSSVTKQKTYTNGQFPTVSASIESISATKNTAGSSFELEYNDDEAEKSSISLAFEEFLEPPLPSPVVEVNLKELVVRLQRLPIERNLNPQSYAPKREKPSLKKNVLTKGQDADSSINEVAEQVFKVPNKNEGKLKRKTYVKSINQGDIDSTLKENLPVAEQDTVCVQDDTGLKDCPESNKKTKPKKSSIQRSRKQNEGESSFTEDVSVPNGLRRSSRVRKTPMNYFDWYGQWELPHSRLLSSASKKKMVRTTSITGYKSTTKTISKKQMSSTKSTVTKAGKNKRLPSSSDESINQLSDSDECQPGPSKISKSAKSISKKQKYSSKSNNKKSITQTRKSKRLQPSFDESLNQLNDYDECEPGPSNETSIQLQASGEKNIESIHDSNTSTKDSGIMYEETKFKSVKERTASRRCASRAKGLNATENTANDLMSNNSQISDCEDCSFNEEKTTSQKFKKLRDDLEVGKVILGPGCRTRLLVENMEVVYFVTEGSAIFHINGKGSHIYAKSELPVVRIPAGVSHVIKNNDGAKPLVFVETKMG